MKDNAITKIIAKTYASIAVFFTFMFLLLVGLFIVLQNGLYLDNVSISNIHAKNVYIKWDDRLTVSVKTLKIDRQKNKTANNVSFKEFSKYLKIVTQTTHWFRSLVVSNIVFGNATGSFKYTNSDQGFFVFQSPDFDFESKIYAKTDLLTVSIKKFQDKKRAVTIKGSVIFDTQAQKVYTKIDLDIHNDANLTVYAIADAKQLIYNVVSNKHITDISHLIKIAHLPKEVIYWAYTAIKMQYLDIQKFHGFIDYSDLQNAYKNIYIQAVAQKLIYTYNPKLEAVKSKQTNLEFKKGVLYIKPQNALTYGMHLGKSWLKIDFNKKEELLTLHLLFEGMLNKDMLHVLNTYKIKLPFLQRKGTVNTDLTIEVNLHTIDVDAKGDFYTKKANFDYLGLNIDIFNTHIHLDNYDVLIDKMQAKYKEIAAANVYVSFNAKKSEGTINLNFHKIETQGLSLDTQKGPLHVAYRINPKQDTIDIDSSKWQYKNKIITLEKLSVDFDLKKLQANIPATYFNIWKMTNGYVNGTIDLKASKTNLDVDLLKLQYSGIELTQTVTPLHIQYDKVLSVSSQEDIFFNVNGSQYKASNFYINFDKQSIYLKHTFLQISDYISTKVYAYYDFDSKKAHISLNDFVLKNPKTDAILYKNNKIMLGGYIDGENITIDSRELDASFVSNEKQWKLTLNALEILAKKSLFLQKYKLNEGKISFYKKSDAPYTQFSATLHYPYHLLVNKNKEISTYTVRGEITKKQKIYLNVNKKMHIKIDKDVAIKIHDAGLNIDAIVKLAKQIATQSNAKTGNFKLSADAIDSYLYLGNNRYAVSDTMHLQYYNNILTAQLIHKKGNAGFKLENNTFHLYGENFNDKFMEKLFAPSKFSGGSLDFSMNGTLEDYKGVFYMHDTVMIDYKLLNNVLAFVNTIPSLVTFSLPGYSKKGLHVKNAYVKFHAKKGVFDISDIYLESKELTILGKGSADINKNSINLVLNLKTDLGSNLSKVPLVGYIIFDGKSISTTLKVTGKLSDPTISTMVAKDIIVAPLNIIKRTLTFPFKVLQKLF
ncbi:AsmA-like C-terminal domain-containing protein [Sulfurimonas hydrogeniphila]|uniref:YhdP family protein n=1 Tax=Sulfurimonas hydrogeniphila TaxID=2509341 RepID=UPI00125F0F5E|nr:AsmA-like C-terminal domain-containing protein [Sulfurimonas hydrogeniphila]